MYKPDEYLLPGRLALNQTTIRLTLSGDLSVCACRGLAVGQATTSGPPAVEHLRREPRCKSVTLQQPGEHLHNASCCLAQLTEFGSASCQVDTYVVIRSQNLWLVAGHTNRETARGMRYIRRYRAGEHLSRPIGGLSPVRRATQDQLNYPKPLKNKERGNHIERENAFWRTESKPLNNQPVVRSI
jgi:hypothetical protein